jgi:CheY-like chemotaxis protein
MVYGFIRQSGGDIHIDSAPGAGTTVRLTLPLQTIRAEAFHIPGRVLLVEDNAAERKAANTLLSPLTDDLLSTGDTADALRHLSTPVRLIVTDLSLHGRIEGWRLAEAALDRWPDARAIVVSGRLPDVDPLSRLFPGRIATLAKPLTAETLSDALCHLFRTPEPDASAART